MLAEKDFQSIGKLLDEKLKTQEENADKKFDKANNRFDEMISIVNDGFTEMQKGFDGLREDIKLRPTMKQIMNWGDNKIVALELDMDKVKYIHQEELDKLPPQAEISRTLIDRGFKAKEAKI